MNAGLSWKVFIPLGRLCYAAYLINLNVTKAYSARMRNPAYYDDIEMFMTFFGIVTSVFLLSFMASLIVEIPFLNLDKLVFKEKSKSIKVNCFRAVCGNYFKQIFLM